LGQADLTWERFDLWDWPDMNRDQCQRSYV